MTDDKKKFPGKRGPGGKAGDGPRGGPRKPADGGKPAWKKDAKPAWKKDGPGNRSARSPRPAGEGGEARSYRPRRDEATASTDAPKRAYRPRAEGEPGGDRPFRKPEAGRPFRKSGPGDKPFGSADAGAKPYRKPSGDRPFRKFEGDVKPFRERPARAPGEGAEKREYRPRRDDAAGATDAPKRAYRPRAEGGDERKPFRKPEGDRPFRKPDGDRPFRARSDGDSPRRGGDRPRSSSDARAPRVRDEAAPEEGERIAKRLARAGISSRRDAEEMIAAGRVKVNGRVLNSPAFNVGPDDQIHVDNEQIPAIERTRVFLFNKPAGVVTTNHDPEGRKTVFDVLPKGLPRLITVGRLDINTEGLLLLTNDGGLARVLELPATGWMRRYRARVHGKVDETALKGLRDGVAVDGVFYGSIEAALDREQGSNAWLTLGLREGKNREVKNVLGSLGLEVSRLIRISFGPFQLSELGEGEVQELKGKTLRDQLGERLIEESGANFEAPVVTEFSNKPVRRERESLSAAPAKEARSLHVGEGGLIKNRKRDRENRREDALGRLQTTRPPMPRGAGKPAGGKPAGGKFGGKPGKREEKPYEPPRSRSSNVWMASGARPQGKKDEDAQKPEGRPRTERGRSEGRSGDGQQGLRRTRTPRKDD